MRPFDYMYDDHTMFVGYIVEGDDTFDHELGSEKRVSYEADDFHIIVWIGGIDIDVTSSIMDGYPKLYETYKKTFIEKYMDQL